jgi:hypothetical protein
MLRLLMTASGRAATSDSAIQVSIVRKYVKLAQQEQQPTAVRSSTWLPDGGIGPSLGFGA